MRCLLLASVLFFAGACDPPGEAPAAATFASSDATATSVSSTGPVASTVPAVRSAIPLPRPSATVSPKPERKRRRHACELPEPAAPTRRAPGGSTTQVVEWVGADDRCRVPKGYEPWSWNMLRRVRGLREKAVIFTVDGGLSVPITNQGLDVLRDYDVRATYFLTTEVLSRVAGGRDLVQRIVTEGHELANHSVSHPKLTELEDDGVKKEILDADAWLTEVAGFSPRPFFRPPFLDRNDRTDRIMEKLCYRPVWFTIYTRDDTPDVKAEDIARAVLCDDEGKRERKIKRGSILMFHASQIETVKAWPVIITGLRERGYRIMTLSEALQARKKRDKRRKRKRRR